MNMDVKYACTLFVSFVVKIGAEVCSNSYGTCSADYKMVEGICQPCYGSYGVNCTENCPTGFFGFGCRSKCYCNATQLCNNDIGCVDVCDPCKLTNCSYVEKAYNILTSAHGINICYNSLAENVECCAGFTNVTGICEKNDENFTGMVDFKTNDAGEY
eukprot:XP_011422116.1 PREDICTED: scavenger receptor class F member 2 [Crassostrea gigas]